MSSFSLDWNYLGVREVSHRKPLRECYIYIK